MDRPVEQDKSAVDYFSEHCPRYSTGRLEHAVARLRSLVPADATVADVGCGAGNVLAYMRDAGGFTNLTGFDPSPEIVEVARETAGCEIGVMSILDDGSVAARAEKFDAVVLAAVLHHLVAGSRSSSARLAAHGMENAYRLVRPGGLLVVVEPTFAPRLPMSAVFYLKRMVTALTKNRVEIGGKWNNIGAPVVSFFTLDELERLAERLAGAESVEAHHRTRAPSRLMRLAGIRRRADTTLIIRKQSLR